MVPQFNYVSVAALVVCSSSVFGQLPDKQITNCPDNSFPTSGNLGNPCEGDLGFSLGHIGNWRVQFKSGDDFDGDDSDKVGKGTYGHVQRITRMHGCAGMYDSIALVKPASFAWLDGGTASTTELSGSKRWLSGFCGTPECECNPNGHLWDFDYSLISTIEMSLNFNNGDPTIASAAGAATSQLTFPFPPGSILVNVNASGEEDGAEVTLNAWAYQDGQGASFALTKNISADTWTRTIPATASRVGYGRRGCGFIGKLYTIQGTTSATSTIEMDASSAYSRGKTFISEDTGTWIVATGDVCVNPLEETGRESRLLRDGTPVREFLEILATADIDPAIKAELLYAANVWGPETDYYAWLLSEDETALEEFYDSIDTDMLGIASIEDFFSEHERIR